MDRFKIGEIMQIAGEDGNRRFALLREGQHLLHTKFRRALLVGELRLEFERDVATKSETPRLAGRPLKHCVEQAALPIQTSKGSLLNLSHRQFSVLQSVRSIHMGDPVTLTVMQELRRSFEPSTERLARRKRHDAAGSVRNTTKLARYSEIPMLFNA